MRLEDFLARLQGVRRRGDQQYVARCPAHEDHTPSLSVGQGRTGIVLTCHTGCSVEAVVGALGLTITDLFDGKPDRGTTPADSLTLDQYAAERQLSPEWLAGLGVRTEKYWGGECLAVPYRDASGNVVATRLRTRGRFWWPASTTLLPYGLDRLTAAPTSKAVLMVEGESDCHATWTHEVLAIGIPGASTWKPEWAAWFADRQVYVWREPDQGGTAFVTKLTTDLPTALVIVPPVGIKDPCALHLSEGAGFRAALAELLPTARPVAPADSGFDPVTAQVMTKWQAARERLGLTTPTTRGR
jgi:hypothetical protein